ncbi:outer membrane protein assembly factor [Alteromonas sediminis]|uniref:Translocation and assembly module subunit TamA n=2 Tax=Alteromonas sediminis TaxID=2259342 RepID=A0A3N5YC70_9ALTE|nr:outer membrane protein assembly factor [Alteromonas sediminis]
MENVNDAFWQRQIQDAINKAVQPYGYYNSESALYVVNNKLSVTVTLNSPLVVTNLTREIIGEGREDKGFRDVFNNFPLKVGDVLYQPKYEDFKSAMFSYALTHGFFDFAWQASRLDLVREEQAANILLIAQSGPQYYFGDVVIKGDARSVAIVERIKPFKKGDKYSAEKLTSFNRRLNQTGYYQRVIARPVVQKAIDRHVPIEITLTHKPKDLFNVGIGASSDEGLRIPLQWQRPWATRRGHSISADLYASQREQSISSNYRIPMQNVNDDYASIGIGYKFLDDTENSNTKSDTLSVSARRFWREEASNWQKSVSLTFERENFTQGLQPAQTTDLLMPGASLTYIDRGETININQGLYFSTSLQVGSEALLSDIDLLKATARTTWIHSLGKHRFKLRGEAGAISTNNFDRVPSTMRFFVGGDQTVRGFALNSISPFEEQTIDGNTTRTLSGGQYLAVASIEYTYPIYENWRVALFFDAGTATNNFDEGISRGTGFGFHWITPVGPVRFYFAFGKSNVDDSSFRFHFALGPEL